MSKGNIKIMSKAQEVSDEEIREMMNFTDLIEKQKAEAVQKAKWNKTVKVATIAASALIVVLLTYIYWPMKKSDTNLSGLNSERIGLNSSRSEKSSTEQEKKTTEEISEVKKENQTSSQPKKEAKEKKTVTPHLATRTDSTAIKPHTPATVEYTEAEPINGFPHLYDYFNRELTYPRSALKDSIQGIETVSFIINKQGKAESIRIVNSLGSAFDKEAMRIVSAMPAWKPAMIDNKPIASKISLPLTFNFHISKQK